MDELICDSSHNWLLEVLYNANKSDVETYRVYKTLARYISDCREFASCIEVIAPSVIRIKPLTDLADDCFFSVVFFKKYIERRAGRTGAPGVMFYTELGKNAYTKTGYSAISKNWGFWDLYINEHISL